MHQYFNIAKQRFLPFQDSKVCRPLHLDINMHILHTVLYTIPKVLTRRICLTIKSLFSC